LLIPGSTVVIGGWGGKLMDQRVAQSTTSPRLLGSKRTESRFPAGTQLQWTGCLPPRENLSFSFSKSTFLNNNQKSALLENS